MEKSIRDIRPAAGAKQIELFNEVAAGISLYVILVYLENILSNLIDNAVKFSCPLKDRPFIRITAQKEDTHTLIRVIDNGLGIDIKRHGDKMFSMYKKFHDITDSKGLGLFFTKNQIEAMDGRIEVESEPEKGSTFNVYIPHAENQ